MPDINTNSDPLTSYIYNQNDPNINQQLRQRIALAMMQSKKAYPKTLGEGLSAIGDSIGDIGQSRQLIQADLAQQAAAKAISGGAPLVAPQAAADPAAAGPAMAAAGDAPPPPPASAAMPPPDDPRAAVTAQLMTPPAPGGPAANPMQPGATPPVDAGSPLQALRQATASSPDVMAQAPGPVGARPPAPVQGILKAPPGAGQPVPVPGYVMPKPVDLPPAQILRPSDRELKILTDIRDNPNNPYVAQRYSAELQLLQANRAARQAALNKEREDRMIHNRALDLEREKQLANQAERIPKVATETETARDLRQKNDLREQFGNMPPDEVFKNVSESHKVANSAAKSLAASQAALAAFDGPGGVITGIGANARLDVAKFFHGMGLVDKGNTIANTETFRNAMAPVVASIMHQTSGTSQLSEGELRFAQRAAAGDITLDAQSVRQLMAIIDKGSRGVIASHQQKVDALFGNSPQAKATFGVEMPRPPARAARSPQDEQAAAWAAANPNDPRAAAIRQRLGM